MASVYTLTFNSNGYQLTGTLHIPDSSDPPVVIGCHGLLANRHSPKQISLANACLGHGMAYFRFDHRGCGDSEGQFARDTSLKARVQDLYHAVETMQHHSQVGTVSALFGSSFGGTVVLDYAAEHPCPNLITYAAPMNSADINRANIRDNSGGHPSASLLTDALEFDIRPKLSNLRNILVSHSKGDETVPVAHALEIFRLCGQPKDQLIFPEGDHRMSDPDHHIQFESRFIDWITNTRQ